MMPCYGEINEREHSLHEVIRLSGTDIPMGDETEEVTVKVASIPGVRLQVYFMDHDNYFSRAGLFHDEDGAPFADNARRALFFNRAVIETIRTLRWGPDVIHNLGWITSLLPALLTTEYAGDDVLGDAKTLFTPDNLDLDVSFTEEEASSLGLSADAANVSVSELGLQHADASIVPADMTPTSGTEHFVVDEDKRGEQAAELYEQMLSEVPA